MSKLCDQVVASLKLALPGARIKEEYYVNYNNQKLFIDIWVAQFNLAIEVHGRQHDEFVSHFHGDAAGYNSYKKRDSLKEEWAGLNNITYIVLRESDLPIDPVDLLLKIIES